MVAPHALPSMTGQECGMDIDDALREEVDEIFGNHRQESSQDNQVDAVFLQQRGHDTRVVELSTRNDGGIHAQALCPCQGERIRTVADHQDHIGPVMVLKILDEVLTIAAVTRHENSDVGHLQ